MQFSSLTLLSLATAVALLSAFARVAPSVGGSVICIVMPVAIMCLALTLPRKGHQLDPAGRWYLALVVRTWLLSIGILLVVSLVFAAFPGLQDRLTRFAKGDSRVHQVWIHIDCSEVVFKQIESKPMQLFYEDGSLIGEIHKSQAWWAPRNGSDSYSIAVSTDRSDFPPNWITRSYTVVIDSNHDLVIQTPR